MALVQIEFVLENHRKSLLRTTPSKRVSPMTSSNLPSLNENSGGKLYFLDLLNIITFDFDSLIFIWFDLVKFSIWEAGFEASSTLLDKHAVCVHDMSKERAFEQGPYKERK